MKWLLTKVINRLIDNKTNCELQPCFKVYSIYLDLDTVWFWFNFASSSSTICMLPVFHGDHDPPPFWVRNVTSGEVSLHWVNSSPSPSSSCFTRWCHGLAGCFRVCPKCRCFCHCRLRELRVTCYPHTHSCMHRKQMMSVFGCCARK